jgi:hypothetical protein
MWIEDEKFNPNIIIYKNKKKKKISPTWRTG